MGTHFVKPSIGTDLDWANPLTRDLKTCIPFWARTGRNLVDIAGGNDALLSWDAPWDGSPTGPSVRFDGADGHWATIGTGNPANIAIGTGSPHTMASIFRVTSGGGQGSVPGIICVQDIPTGRAAILEFYDLNAGDGSAKLRCEIWDGSSGPAIQDTVNLVGESWHTGVMTIDGVNMALYRDGILIGTSGYSLLTIDQPATNWYLGARPDQYGGISGASTRPGFVGGMSLALIATRAWSAEEVRNWSGNPWQIFESASPWYMIEHSLAAPTASLFQPATLSLGSGGSFYQTPVNG